MKALLLVAAMLAAGCQAQPVPADAPVLIGGTPANGKDWPASVYVSMSNARCSATLIGERTVLVAAHCPSNGGSLSFSVGANRYTGRCTHHGEYAGNSTADWALCLTDRKVEDVPYENVLTDASKLTIGKLARLTGYGCIRPGGGGGNDGIFRIGEAPVKSKPSGRNYDTVTAGKAALCFGDSGGAAYLEVGKDRYVFGVNSRGDISTTSYLSSTYVPTFLTFAKSWAATNGQKLCGIDQDAPGCRGSVAPVPNEFTFDTDLASGAVKMKAGKESLLEQAKAALLKALEDVRD